MKRLLSLTGLAGLLAIAGCGGSSSSSSSSSASAPASTSSSTAAASTPAASGATTVTLRPSNLGQYLVDGTGRTVYLFLADKPGKSACYGACAKVWEPLPASGAPTGGPGVASAKLSTLTRTDGVTQVLYNGHALYHYDDDHKSGQMAGQGKKEFGAEWYVLSAAGAKLEAKGA
jgi:predicted lipoprotein with Yx(FWY)xxD motif